VQQFARVIDANARRLARMITDLLDMDRLESGQRRVRLGLVDLESLIRDVVETLAGLDHRHEITLRVGRDVPPVQADGDLLTQLVTNLVTNAIKYTPAGGQIGIDVARAGADAVEIAVTDSGPGIPPDALETIFGRFARLARDERQQIVGSGLGLPITRQIAELHGGRIWAENIESGARFVVHLPIAGPALPG
jgi:signal transduction histidine kinase